jgi:hypothetical protein
MQTRLDAVGDDHGERHQNSRGRSMSSAGSIEIEGTTGEDTAFRGSTFREVSDAVFANSYQRVWGAPGELPLPVHKVTFASVVHGVLRSGRTALLKAAERTVDSRADLRWGPDGTGFRRLLHPNGICLTGRWQISEPSGYSGYFADGKTALVIARYSTCCTETRRGFTRSLSMVGKLFPTADPNDTRPVRTANFITQQDIGGDRTDYVNDAELRNAPDTTVLRRGTGLPVILLTGMALTRADRMPSIRQLYEIAELGKPAGEPTRTPEFLRFVVAPEQPRIPGEKLDFRDEIMAQIYDRGDPTPKRTLTFLIEVTDEGRTSGPPVRERRTFRNWKRIGRIVFDRAVASHNGDAVIHFSHPTWRDDRNDPATATRVNGRKVRR